jgi:hypothetical protein
MCSSVLISSLLTERERLKVEKEEKEVSRNVRFALSENECEREESEGSPSDRLIAFPPFARSSDFARC